MRAACLFCVVFLIAAVLNAQTPTNDTGISAHQLYAGDRETISPVTGNLNIQIPLAHFPGRAGHDYDLSANYNSNMWSFQTYYDGLGNPHYIWNTDTVPFVGSYGWILAQEAPFVRYDQSIYVSIAGAYCNSNYVVVLPDGSKHNYGPYVRTGCYTIVGNNIHQPCPVCDSPLSSNPDSDRPATYLQFDASIMTATDRNGTQYVFPSNGGMATSVKDRQGNTLLAATVNRQITSSGSSANGFPATISYLDDNGNAAVITFTPVQVAFSPSFPYGRVTNPPATIGGPGGNAAMIGQITLPDGTFYSFSYDNYGEITKITYPHGGYTRYDYDNFSKPQADNSGLNNARFLTAKHVCRLSTGSCTNAQEDHTYYSVFSGSSYTAPSWTTDQYGMFASSTNTITDPSGNRTVITRTAGSPSGTEQIQIYDGNNVVRTIVKTHPLDVDKDYPSTSEVTTLDGGSQSRKDFTYDGYYDPTQIKETDYDGRVRTTNTSYFSGYRNQNPHILDLVTSSTVLEGTSTWMAQTDYVIDDYSTYALDGTNNGAYGHDTNYGTSKTNRGNVTAVKQYPAQNASPFISYAGFDTLGNTVVSQDAKGRITSYRFTDSFGTKTTCLPSGATLNAFPDQITNPKNQISKFTYYSCSGKVWKAQNPNDLADTPVRDGTIFVYDNMFRLTSTTFPDGGVKSTNYGGSTLPITVTATQTATPDPSIVSTAIHDGLGRVIQTRLATGTSQGDIITDSTYDPTGQIATRSNPHYSTVSSTDGTTQYQYDGLGRLKQTTNPDATFTTVQFSGNCLTTTDEAGVQRKTCADARGRLIEVDEAGEGWTSGMAPAGGTGSVTISGTEQSVTQQTGSTTPGTRTLTINGGPQSRLYCPPVGGCYTIWNSGAVYITVNGLQKSASYGGSSNVSASLASTIATAFNGDASSSVTASASSNTITFTAKTSGASTNYAFSSTSTWNSGQGFTSAAYSVSPSSGNLTGGQDATYTTTYDSGNVSITVNGFAKSATFGQGSTGDSIATALRTAFNNDSASPVTAGGAAGQVTLTSKLTGSATNYSLSSSRTWNSGTFAQASFNTSNSGSTLTGGTDGQHNGVFSLSTPYVTYYKYDALDNLLCVEQHGDTPTSTTSCLSPTDGIAGGNWRVRKFQYDALSRLLQADNPESGRITYTYDSVGNLLTKQSPLPNQSSGTVTINYSPTESPIDALNRVTKKTYSNGDPAVVYTYDETSVTGISGFTNGIGRRTGMTDASGSTVWNYDPVGRAKTERRTIGTITKTVINGYNTSGAVTSITYPSTRVVSYGHDAAGRTLNATDSNGTQYVSQVVYFPTGGINTANYGAVNGGFTGIAINNTYNNRLQPVALTATAPGPPAVTVMDLRYNFGWSTNDNGNVLSITNNKSSARTVNYTYDALNRIRTAVTPNANTWGNTFTVDPWGNLTKMLSYDAQHPEGQHFDQQADTNNRLVGWVYDGAGNLTQNLSATYTYDSESRLTIAGGITYTYDGDGNRVKKSNGLLYWGQGVTGSAAESDFNGNIAKEFVFFNRKRCARIDISSGAVHYYFSDHLDSSNVVTNASGGVEEESDFYPFGGERVIADTLSDQNYKFTGKERDSESGLDNFGARYDSSSMGRFMSPDAFFKDSHVGDPQSWNKYAYVRNNPLRYTDPNGEEATVSTSCTTNQQNQTTCNVQVSASIAIYSADGANLSQQQLNTAASTIQNSIQTAWTGSFTQDGVTYNVSTQVSVSVAASQDAAMNSGAQNVIGLTNGNATANADSYVNNRSLLSGSSPDTGVWNINNLANGVAAHEFTHLLGVDDRTTGNLLSNTNLLNNPAVSRTATSDDLRLGIREAVNSVNMSREMIRSCAQYCGMVPSQPRISSTDTVKAGTAVGPWSFWWK